MFFNIAAFDVAEGALGPTKGDGTTGGVTTGVAATILGSGECEHT